MSTCKQPQPKREEAEALGQPLLLLPLPAAAACLVPSLPACLVPTSGAMYSGVPHMEAAPRSGRDTPRLARPKSPSLTHTEAGSPVRTPSPVCLAGCGGWWVVPDVSVLVEQDVLWLEVPEHDGVPVQVVQCAHQLGRVEAGRGLAEPLATSQVEEQLATATTEQQEEEERALGQAGRQAGRQLGRTRQAVGG